MKKTLIICIILILAALAGLGWVAVPKLQNGEKLFPDIQQKASKAPNNDMSYEEFIKPMKKDLSDEVMAEVDKLYKQMIVAEDEEEINKLYNKLIQLGVYEGKDKAIDKKAGEKKK